MKVIIDSEIFSAQTRGGISRHFSVLIKYLNFKKNIKVNLNSTFHSNFHLKEEKLGIFLLPKLRRLSRLFLYFKRLISPNADIIHHTFYYKSLKKVSIPMVTNAYDMIPENGLTKNIDPYLIEAKYKSFKLSDAIVCISNFTKEELLKFYPEFKNKVHKIHLGASNQWALDRNYKYQNFLKKNKQKFITHIGNRHQYKNGSFLIDLLTNIEDIDLVYIGGEKPSIKEIEKINKYQLNSRVSFIRADDNKLRSIMKSSYAICLPSRMEGFSLPLIEALYLDIPVIASNIPVHEEVGGKFAHLLNQENPEEWSSLLKNRQIPKPSQILGLDAYKKIKKYFSYERVVLEHIDLYKKLLN